MSYEGRLGDIGGGSVIGLGALAVKPVPPYSVAVGVPAKPLKRINFSMKVQNYKSSAF